MGIPRGTTPTFTLTFTDVDLTTAANVYVTFSQGHRTVTKTGEDITVSATTIDVELTQGETLGFYAGKVQIQANWTTSSGKRFASNVATYELTKQLLQKVVE